MNLRDVGLPMAPKTGGLGAEISSTIQEEALLHQEAPIKRITGFDDGDYSPFVGVASYQVMASPYVTAEAGDQAALQEQDTELITVEAQRYGWTFYYNESSWDGQAEVTTRTDLKIPANQTYPSAWTSKDWLEILEAFRDDYGRVPDRIVLPIGNAGNTGAYKLYVPRTVRSGHSQMLGTVEVVPQDEYEDWPAEQKSGGDSEGSRE